MRQNVLITGPEKLSCPVIPVSKDGEGPLASILVTHEESMVFQFACRDKELVGSVAWDVHHQHFKISHTIWGTTPA